MSSSTLRSASYLRNAVISSSIVSAICCTSLCVGGSVTTMPSVSTELLFVLVSFDRVFELDGRYLTEQALRAFWTLRTSGPSAPGFPSTPAAPSGLSKLK